MSGELERNVCVSQREGKLVGSNCVRLFGQACTLVDRNPRCIPPPPTTLFPRILEVVIISVWMPSHMNLGTNFWARAVRISIGVRSGKRGVPRIQQMVRRATDIISNH
jgi:hypothetical protein